ncbi:OLC1v1004141C1 [Oldenlandia corymbosa var. corymbosa]|uniref:OLC1v1004141C1 n=1 Tax=Oldenlandia corymbosa var. corymbosa TaxID=529605 RepID=A0AAV1DEL9_OLDCO|nr:OLC1v1004141C1 [Oldenlandia corymbosa var. corymbosa]
MMYGQQSNNMNANEFPIFYSPSSPSSSSTEIFQSHFPSSSSLPAPLAIPVNEYEYLSALKSELNHSSSSGCSSYNSPTSLTSYYGSPPTSLTSFELANNPNSLMMQRSISSHSLLHNKNFQGFSPLGYLDSAETSPVRKVLSAGDLQCMNPKPHNHRSDNSLATEYSIIESMSKACKYSPEEKKERIERYRSKRNLRNFNKKIKVFNLSLLSF